MTFSDGFLQVMHCIVYPLDNITKPLSISCPKYYNFINPRFVLEIFYILANALYLLEKVRQSNNKFKSKQWSFILFIIAAKVWLKLAQNNNSEKHLMKTCFNRQQNESKLKKHEFFNSMGV